MKKIVEWQKLTNFEIEKLDQKFLVIPIGSTEAHGHHLSVDNDNIIAQFLAKKLCEKIDAIYGIPLTIGNTAKLIDFPGSMHVSESTLKSFLKDVLISYLRAGIEKILIINAHRGNNNYIQKAIDEIKNKNIRYVFYKDLIAEDLDETYAGFHSNRLETEIALLAKKESVEMSAAKNHFVKNRELLRDKFDRKFMPDCIDGFPEKANLADAEKNLNLLLQKLEEIAGEI